jgi:hypothetical protein
MSGLPADGFPAVAVGASNLALLDLRSKVLERILIEGERHDTLTALRPDVVEFQHHHIGLPAADTSRVAKVVQQVAQVAPLEWPVGGDVLL